MVILLKLIFKIPAKQFALCTVQMPVGGSEMSIRDDSVKMLHSIKPLFLVEKRSATEKLGF